MSVLGISKAAADFKNVGDDSGLTTNVPPLMPVELGPPPREMGVGSPVGFVLTPKEVVPALITRLHGGGAGRIDLNATIMAEDSRPNPSRDSYNTFNIRWQRIERPFQRVRSQDPPVMRGDQIAESFGVTSYGLEPGGPLTAGTWFDLRPWTITLVATRYEQRDNHKIIIVTAEERQIGQFDGADYGLCYAAFCEARSKPDEATGLPWDKVTAMFRLKESL